jgi:hypothetical protein
MIRQPFRPTVANFAASQPRAGDGPIYRASPHRGDIVHGATWQVEQPFGGTGTVTLDRERL